MVGASDSIAFWNINEPCTQQSKAMQTNYYVD